MALRTKLVSRDTPQSIQTKQQRSDYKAALRQGIANYIRLITLWIAENTAKRTPGKIPIATGYLSQSSQAVVSQSKVMGTGFEAHFGFDAPYAVYADEGSEPHWVPLAELKTWCKTVGIPEELVYAIRGKIKAVGTTGYHFFTPGVMEAKRILREELSRAFRFYDLQVNVRI